MLVPLFYHSFVSDANGYKLVAKRFIIFVNQQTKK